MGRLIYLFLSALICIPRGTVQAQVADSRDRPDIGMREQFDDSASVRTRLPRLDEAARIEENRTNKRENIPRIEFKPYGFIKADASYDNSRTSPGNFVLYVDEESAKKNDDEFNLTANQSRLGVQIRELTGETVQVDGRLEIDFYGNNADENKAKIQMRHAYFEVFWPSAGINLLAGQSWDVVSPLNPSTINYSVLWTAGNIGYRRPQIRLTKRIPLGRSSSLDLQGAIARTVGHSVPGLGPQTDTGEDTGYPTVQGRVGVVLPSSENSSWSIGMSAHYGTEECDTSATGNGLTFNSWSVNIDYQQPLTEWLSVQAEAFRGSNLRTYLGGAGQGLRVTKSAEGVDLFDKEIASRGGWIAAYIRAGENLKIGLGAGTDDVVNTDINAGDRTFNSVFFGNVSYSLTQHATVGLELSRWSTGYLGADIADDLRAQTALTYNF